MVQLIFVVPHPRTGARESLLFPTPQCYPNRAPGYSTPFACGFASHHAWERGTNKDTNGLIRQYLPKGQSMARLTQHDCNAIARQPNQRPRKRLGYRTPEEYYAR